MTADKQHKTGKRALVNDQVFVTYQRQLFLSIVGQLAVEPENRLAKLALVPSYWTLDRYISGELRRIVYGHI